MATARLCPPAKPTIILELSYEEAQILAHVTGSICGCPDNSPRKHTDGVYDALNKLDLHPFPCSSHGVITFMDSE